MGAVWAILIPSPPGAPTVEEPVQPPAQAANPGDYFQSPLPTWDPHCLGFGSPWTYCNGTALRACASGAVWRHTGADLISGIQPVMAAGDDVIRASRLALAATTLRQLEVALGLLGIETPEWM